LPRTDVSGNEQFNQIAAAKIDDETNKQVQLFRHLCDALRDDGGGACALESADEAHDQINHGIIHEAPDSPIELALPPPA